MLARIEDFKKLQMYKKKLNHVTNAFNTFFEMAKWIGQILFCEFLLMYFTIIAEFAQNGISIGLLVSLPDIYRYDWWWYDIIQQQI